MFNHILCATDASDDADRALDYAARIAADTGGELHLVHVIEKLVAGKVAGQNADLFEHDHCIKLRQQCVKLSDRGIEVTLHTPYARTGTVARCVANIAKDNDVDLIVAGTRGRSALAGAVLGSVAQELLHTSACPVLAVPHSCVENADADADADAAGDADALATGGVTMTPPGDQMLVRPRG